MKVYIYRDARDYDSFNQETIRVFADKEDAIRELKKEVELFFAEPWERCVEIVEEEEGSIWPTYVEYPTGGGYTYFSVTEYKVEGGNM